MTHELPSKHAVPETDATFADLGLSKEILHALDQVEFVHPTPIQAAVIPEALAGKDVIGCAQTGTGKTAAFVLPLAERLTHGKGTRGVILCPTREIALQTQAFIELFGEHHHLTSAVLIGGVKINPQFSELKKQPDIIVATPGRLLDHLDRKTAKLGDVTELVFDEADRMLDMGFLPQIDSIMKFIPSKRQTMMFSATMPFQVRRLTERFMKDPVQIDMAPPGTTAAGIEQSLYLVDLKHKRAALLELLKYEGSTLIFSRMKQDVDRLARYLDTQMEGQVARLHSDRTQKERVEALENFREGKFRILIATDIAARGLDIPEIAHVIHFDVSDNPEDYVHRSGRTARYYREGKVSVIATWMDRPNIEAIEKTIDTKLPRCTLPDVPAFVERKARSMGRLRPRIRSRPR